MNVCENMNQGFSLNKVTFLILLLILLCICVLYLHSIVLRCYTAHCIVKIKSKIIFQIKKATKYFLLLYLYPLLFKVSAYLMTMLSSRLCQQSVHWNLWVKHTAFNLFFTRGECSLSAQVLSSVSLIFLKMSNSN